MAKVNKISGIRKGVRKRSLFVVPITLDFQRSDVPFAKKSNFKVKRKLNYFKYSIKSNIHYFN